MKEFKVWEMDEKDKIAMCSFWIKYPNMLGENPEIYGTNDVEHLIQTIAGEGEFTLRKVEDYKRILESHSLQKESNDLQKKSVSYKREIIIIIITIVLTAIISNIDRIIGLFS